MKVDVAASKKDALRSKLRDLIKKMQKRRATDGQEPDAAAAEALSDKTDPPEEEANEPDVALDLGAPPDPTLEERKQFMKYGGRAGVPASNAKTKFMIAIHQAPPEKGKTRGHSR